VANGVLPGERTAVFDTDFGRLGLAVCFDLNWQPVWADLKAHGAELVCWISAYEGGLPLQAFAWIYQYPIVTSSGPTTPASSSGRQNHGRDFPLEQGGTL